MASLFPIVACGLLVALVIGSPEETCTKQHSEVSRSLLQSAQHADQSFSHEKSRGGPSAPTPTRLVKSSPMAEAGAEAAAAIKTGTEFMKGCKKVFFDLGARDGSYVRKLFEPEKYPESSYLPYFDNAFGSLRNGSYEKTGICALGFEADPRWKKPLKKIEKSYLQMGWKVHFFVPLAVSDKSKDNKTVYFNDHARADKNMYSWWPFARHEARAEKVPSIDISKFVVEVALHKEAGGYSLVKMDIEAAEYDVLPKFMAMNLLCKKAINEITVKWHNHFLSKKDKHKDAELRDSIYFYMKDEGKSGGICGPAGASEFHEIHDDSRSSRNVPLPEISPSIRTVIGSVN